MANVSVERIVRQALGRVNDVTDTYPSVRAPMYRRVGLTQRALFLRVASFNPEYAGVNASLALESGSFDLNTLPELPELIQRVEIANPGTSGLSAGLEVSIVTMSDPAAELAPRATIRSGILSQVGTDLALVTSLRLFFAHVPASFASDESGGSLIELPQPWDGILELDLAAWVVSKATTLPDNVRATAMSKFSSERTELEDAFESHVKSTAPTVQRFHAPLARPGGVM